MTIKKIVIISGIISLLIPFITYSQVNITEIMYDPEGSDTKREWIEVFNAGTTPIDLSTYFFFEGNVYHKLIAQSNAILESGAYAIIVDSVAEVVSDYVGFMGKIFDSAFSLNNTGETISMANFAKEIIDTQTYTNTMGANNDTFSLQINGDQIISASPTFGTTNKTQSETPIIEDTGATDSSTSTTDSPPKSTSGSTSTHIQQEPISTYTPPAVFKISAGRNRFVTLNTPIEFEAYVSQGNVSPKFLWNFGDFNTSKGKKSTHIYEYTGTYEVVLEGKTKDHTKIARTQVQVVEPQLDISMSTTTIFVHNKSKQEVNIGGFVFGFKDGESFDVPRNTIIKGGAGIQMPISLDKVLQDFRYPNDEIYEQFDTI